MTATPTKAVARKPSPASRSQSPATRSTPVKGGAAPVKKSGVKAPSGNNAQLKKRPPSAPKPGEFVASKKWDGPRTGMVFQNGVHGTGYYKDPSGGYTGTDSNPASSERDLDAAEVFAMLPLSMQVAFEARDINALDAALSALPPEEAEVHMHRCVASGLWDPNGGGGGVDAS